MCKAIRTSLSVLVSLVLFSALTMAHAAGKNADKEKTAKHHSRLSKLAFWRHHRNADNNAKQAQVTPATRKQAQSKTAQIKPALAKQAPSKPSPKKASAANKTKPDPTVTSSKQ